MLQGVYTPGAAVACCPAEQRRNTYALSYGSSIIVQDASGGWLMKLWKKPVFLFVVISSCFALLSSCGLTTPPAIGKTPQLTNPPITCGVWNEAPSPHLSTRVNSLNGVAALSLNDVWAVGSSGDFTLVEHWNGTQWSVVTSPNVDGSTSNELSGVAAITANDVWAVGVSSVENPYTQQALIEHWNGTQWNMVENPASASKSTALHALVAVSAQDIWAVGSDTNGALFEHWDGSTWSVVKSSDGSSDALWGVTAVSTRDVWAVGTENEGSDAWHTLLEHWDGTTWNVVAKNPHREGISDALTSIAVRSPNDIWAVGESRTAFTPSARSIPLLEHWDGSQLSTIQLPTDYGAGLSGILAVSASDIWAVGHYETESGEPSPSSTLIEHWNGTTWSRVNSPNGSGGLNGLMAVARVLATRSIWAVGFNGDPSTTQPLIERYC